MYNRQLLVNKIQCPDGTIIESRGHHHFVEHVQEDGREYGVDGGLSYQRILFSDEEYTNLAVYADDDHELIRQHFKWTNNYDKDMNLLPEPVQLLLKDITEPHLIALVDWTADGYPDYINKVFVDEKAYREL